MDSQTLSVTYRLRNVLKLIRTAGRPSVLNSPCPHCDGLELLASIREGSERVYRFVAVARMNQPCAQVHGVGEGTKGFDHDRVLNRSRRRALRSIPDLGRIPTRSPFLNLPSYPGYSTHRSRMAVVELREMLIVKPHRKDDHAPQRRQALRHGSQRHGLRLNTQRSARH